MNGSASTAYPQVDPSPVHSYTHLLCHYGELTLRGRNRRYFEDQLIIRIRARLDVFGVRSVRKLHGSVLFAFANPYDWPPMSAALSKVFGLANAHGVWICQPDIEEISARVSTAVTQRHFASFAVRCRRANKRFPLRSLEICTRLGREVQAQTGARVDLEHPELTIWIEVLDHEAFVGCDRVQGPAGLPSATSGRVLCLLSGGIDSPVAAWRMMQRGCEVVALHFHSYPFTSAASQEKVVELTRLLAQWQGPIRLGMLPFGEIQQMVVRCAPEAWRVIIYRRLMVRMAVLLAREVEALSLITGDSLGQVASQTLANLATIEAAAELPILRPLVGLDKIEITRTARSIGTFTTSIEPEQDCCGYMEPRQPATRSTPEELARAEAGLDIAALVQQGMAGVQWRVVG